MALLLPALAIALLAKDVHGFIPSPGAPMRGAMGGRELSSISWVGGGSRPVSTPNRCPSTRLFGRVTPRTDQKAEEGADQGVPKSLGSAESEPLLTANAEGMQDQRQEGEGGEMMPVVDMTGDEDWTSRFEARLQEMYAQGTYDPTPVSMTQEELARQQWLDDLLNKEDRPIEWTVDYWLGTFLRSDTRFPSPGRAVKSFGFATVGIVLVTLLFLVEDEIINPVFDDFRAWDGNDWFHFYEDLGGWAASVPHRVQDYVTHFDLREYLARVSARAGAAPRWYQQVIGPLADAVGP